MAFECTCAFLAGAFLTASPGVVWLSVAEISLPLTQGPPPASMGVGLALLGLGFVLMLVVHRRVTRNQ